MSFLAKRLEEEEGRVKHVYPDSLGFATIGVGCMVDRRKNGGLRDNEIDFILNNRIDEAERELRARFPWSTNLDDVRHGALINMAFQLGVPGLSGFKKFLEFMRVQDFGAAARECLDSDWAKQTPARAKRISEEIRTGEWQWK